jgi:hypothetical protein
LLAITRRIAVLGLATLALCAGAGIAAAAPAKPSAASPPDLTWRFIYRGNDKAVFDTVAPVSQRDAWVAGDYNKGTTALILHWNGVSWHSVPVPDARGFMPWYSGESSADDVWFVGWQNTSTGQTARALIWTSSGWRSHSLPAGLQGFLSLDVLGRNDVWLANSVLCAGNNPHPAHECSDLLWHWNGTSWRQYELPIGISSLAGSSATNVWVAGFVPDGGKVNALREHFYAYRWTGSRWHAASIPHPLSVGCIPGIDTTSPSDVWLSTCGEQGKKTNLVLHWTGRKWQEIWGLGGEAPIIDGSVGVWLGPTIRWTSHGVGYAQLPTVNASMSFPDVMKVPGTTTLLAVGETWTTNAARARTYMAIVGGRFGPYRSAADSHEASSRARIQKLVSPGGIALPSVW